IGRPEDRVVLFSGPLTGGVTRQDELKLEAQAEAFRSMRAIGVGLAEQDTRLGMGPLLSFSELSGGRVVASSLRPSASNPFVERIAKGPVLFGSISEGSMSMAAALREQHVTSESAIESLLEEAKQGSQVAILNLDGSEQTARNLAQKHPELGAIIYRSTGSPPKSAIRVGNVWLLSPGEKGKYLLKVRVTNKGLSDYAPIDLGPAFADDKAVGEIYHEYLKRVASENLLDKMVRRPSNPFAGSQACKDCHSREYRIWAESQHSKALKTLENDSHDRDPDCVGCHVVGLESQGGFTSRRETPFLTDVGCESCHGPAKAHSAAPYTEKMPIVGEKSCQSCHVPEHSPGFDFKTYWEKIKH
ncbi:MAG TPA: cytochrome c family protein, partial [Fimbriimonadaceae bacterium]|nr:cytochrome c family protein [Fimbriimonadaceae bacterium]